MILCCVAPTSAVPRAREHMHRAMCPRHAADHVRCRVQPGSFNITNELVNGRAAMLGLLILGVYEAIRRVPLF